MKKLLLPLLLAVIIASPVLAGNTLETVNIHLTPLVNGNLVANTSTNFTFRFATGSDCTGILQDTNQELTTDDYGRIFTSVNISNVTTTPLYMCEYRGGVLNATHKLNTNLYENITYSENSPYLTMTGNYFGFDESALNTTIDARSGGGDTVWSRNDSDIINQSDALAFNWTTLNDNFVGQTEYANLDTDSTDDVESGDSAGGDLSGTYPSPTVRSDSHNHAVSNLTGKTSAECGGTDQVTNVTLEDGTISLVCSAQGAGAGISSLLFASSNTTGSGTAGNGDTINLTAATGGYLSITRNNLTYTINASAHTVDTDTNCNASGSCNEGDVAYMDFANTGFFYSPFYNSTGSLKFNFHDDGSELTMNVSNASDAFMIVSDNSMLEMYNNPTAGNDYKSFLFDTKIGSVETSFVMYQAGAERGGWYARSFRLGGAEGSSCDNMEADIFSYVDCNTSVTGADLLVQDDIWLGGGIWGNGTWNITEAGAAAFTDLESDDWTNVTITESQISDLSHPTIPKWSLNTSVLENETGEVLGLYLPFFSAWDQLASDDLTTATSWGGDLSGTGSSPSVRANSTTLALANITDVGNLDTDSTDDVESGDTAGGDLSGTYPDPSVRDDSHNHALANITATGNLDTDSTDDITTSGGTITGNLVINGNLTLIGDVFNATVTDQYLNGSFLPDVNDTFDLGSSARIWNDLFVNKVTAEDWTNASITESQVTDADWWDADADISADEISESKINFVTACAAGNHYYLNGNDLACEADDDTTYSEDDAYLTLAAEVFGFNEAKMNTTIADLSDFDTNTHWLITSSEWILNTSDNLEWDETQGNSTYINEEATAGGDLSGTLPNPSVRANSTTLALANITDVGNLDTDSTDDVESGDSAGGDLGGTYPNPSVNDDSHNHSVLNVTGRATAECGGSDQVTNVTLENGVMSVTCSAQGSGGGMTSFEIASSNTTGSGTVADGDSVNITAATGGYVTVTRDNHTITINASAHTVDTTVPKWSLNSTVLENETGGVLGFVLSFFDNFLTNNTGVWNATIESDDWSNVTITESQVTDADWWDADADIDADEISEGKIAFSTACAAGNHFYLNGNDLACEADAIGMATWLLASSNTTGTETVDDGETVNFTAATGGYLTITRSTNTLTFNATAHTTDTNASQKCSGTTTYLDGEDNCDDISTVYVSTTGDAMTGNLTMTGGNITFSDGHIKLGNGPSTGSIADNSTCTILYSPNGNSRIEICN